MKIEPERPFVYFDVSIGQSKVGRIVFQLFSDLAPLATENFINLCHGTVINDRPLGYKNTVFHRVIKNFIIQGGDVDSVYSQETYPCEKLGQASISTINHHQLFKDENLTEPLDDSFKLCMANDSQPDSNGSQFFITTLAQPHLTGKHTVFGTVVHGKSVVREIEKSSTRKDNVPETPVIITDCGDWNIDMPVPIFNASYDQRGGDIFEEYPDDDSHIDKESSESVYHASVKIKESGTLLFKAGDKQSALFKYRKCLRYVMEYFPDQDDEPQWFEKYQALKKSLYLNLSLVSLQLSQFQRAVDYATYLLEMDTISSQEKAKAHFRKGSGLVQLRKYKPALVELKSAQSLVPDDVAIQRELTRCEELLLQQKNLEKKKYAKFFS
jgi:cyclophilin family peptidyl-prolyl cis-trans isomerase